MQKKIGVVMDAIEHIKPHKDTTFYLLLKAQALGFTIYYFTVNDLFVEQGKAFGHAKLLSVKDDNQAWFNVSAEQIIALADLDYILMRKDPPFDTHYIYATYILELAEHAGVKVVNKPQSLRDANEKMFTNYFSELCPKMLVSAKPKDLLQFIAKHQEVILKPLDGMGGKSIFLVKQNDPNTHVIIETLTQNGQQYIMAQVFIPEIKNGDKRILLIHGKPVPFGLARIPTGNEIRGNLAVGGYGVVKPLTDNDYKICARIGDTLINKGLLFVGIDVIGEYLTEINVTSPTCAREIANETGIDIAGLFFDEL